MSDSGQKLNDAVDSSSMVSLQVYIEDVGNGVKEIGLMVLTNAGSFGIQIPREKAQKLAEDLRKAADVLSGKPLPHDARLLS